MFKRVHSIKYLHDARKDLRNKITPEELALWYRLKNNQLGYKFRRQHSIGNFIADFYCAEKKLVIELDGSQHLDNQVLSPQQCRTFLTNTTIVHNYYRSKIDLLIKL